MNRLSSPITSIRPHYQIVVVGSGYGGAIAASRLARAGQQVCLLERGKELQPGEYPRTSWELRRQVQMDFPKRHRGSRTGLYDFRINREIHALAGCGLGGTSLINANAASPPLRGVFDDHWPAALRADVDNLLGQDFRRAEDMLKPTPYPEHFPRLPKLVAHEQCAEALGETFYRVPINVTFEDGTNHVGVDQQACKLCGDCITGCNHAAKNTLLMNYLPDARNHGVVIFTQVQVRRIEREGNHWLVFYRLLGFGREKFDPPEMFVSADVVILGAGSLGSTEILLRSKAAGLPLSDRLGQRFTGNGDFIGFSYNSDVRVDGVGYGKRKPEGRDPVGPCITGIIDMREGKGRTVDEGMIIEDGTVPGPMASRLLPFGLAAASVPLGRDTDRGFGDFLRELWRQLVGFVLGPYYGAVRHTHQFLSASHDDAGGRMYLEDDRLRIDWPGAGQQPSFERLNQSMFQAARALGGTYIKHPLWRRVLGKDVITSHPLGGCTMAEDAAGGVVNDRNQVFESGTAVHEGLYVMDGAVVPRSIGINPLMTISSLAERSTRLLARNRGWQIDYTLPSRPKDPPRQAHVGLQFTENMAGHFSTAFTDELPPLTLTPAYFQAERQGIEEQASFAFVLTVLSEDLDAFLADPNHEGHSVGTVVAPTLSPHPLLVTGGGFRLFPPLPDRPKTHPVIYHFKLTTRQGRRYRYDGFKLACRAWGNGPWGDTSTMYFQLREGHEAGGPVVGTGITRLKFLKWLVQLTTTRANNAPSRWELFKQTMRFNLWFAGSMIKIYGWRVIFPGRKKRRFRPSYACD